MVIALLALFAALAGGAYAVAFPANSVGTAQLRARAITTSKIANGAVRASKLGFHAVTTSRIADGAVIPSKIHGTVASAKSADRARIADNADKLGGHPASSYFAATRIGLTKLTAGSADKTLATVGPFTFTAHCATPAPNSIQAQVLVSTSQDNSAVFSDSNSAPDLDKGSMPLVVAQQQGLSSLQSIGDSRVDALAPDGTALQGRFTVGIELLDDNSASAPDCAFAGSIVPSS
jgi:hypothetical protein